MKSNKVPVQVMDELSMGYKHMPMMSRDESIGKAAHFSYDSGIFRLQIITQSGIRPGGGRGKHVIFDDVLPTMPFEFCKINVNHSTWLQPELFDASFDLGKVISLHYNELVTQLGVTHASELNDLSFANDNEYDTHYVLTGGIGDGCQTVGTQSFGFLLHNYRQMLRNSLLYVLNICAKFFNSNGERCKFVSDRYYSFKRIDKNNFHKDRPVFANFYLDAGVICSYEDIC